MDSIRAHEFVLEDGDLRLRPLTEADWDTIAPWNQDPEVLWFSEGDDVRTRSLDEIRHIFRSVGRAADLFVFELDGIPIGDGWAQEMNLPLVLDTFADRRCMRVDLALARDHWSQGIGTRAIRLLTAHAFARGADLVFAVDIADYNERSQRAFIRNGYLPWRRVPSPPGAKTRSSVYLVCRPAVFDGTAPAQPHPLGGTMAADDPKGSTIVLYRRTPELELLVLHRASEGPGYEGDWAWTPPAGARLPAELPDECASRELHEEVGLELAPTHHADCGVASWWAYSVELPDGAAIVLDHEHDRFEWLAPDEAAVRCQPEVVSRTIRCVANVLDGHKNK